MSREGAEAEFAQHLPPALAAAVAAAAREGGEREDTRYRVWAENWPSLQLFLGLSTQWRRAGLGAVAIGLDYTAVAPTAALLGIELDAGRFADLQAMEGAALRAWAEKRRSES